MILEFNYDCKTITVKDQINLKEFIKEVKKSGIDLSEWSVKSEVVYSSYPIITYPQPYIPYYGTIPCSPSIAPITCDDLTSGNISINNDTTDIDSVWNQQFSYTS